ncbi:unnamed protein product [Lactuca virosa]|uniref:Uncharacterized protein n=1 Tax=Lactuca virosa TaxID=75947 RepID=A0AAU9LH37_9ASTR|nr:unnamed protein product [Lactuca virosa]
MRTLPSQPPFAAAIIFPPPPPLSLATTTTTVLLLRSYVPFNHPSSADPSSPQKYVKKVIPNHHPGSKAEIIQPNQLKNLTSSFLMFLPSPQSSANMSPL